MNQYDSIVSEKKDKPSQASQLGRIGYFMFSFAIAVFFSNPWFRIGIGVRGSCVRPATLPRSMIQETAHIHFFLNLLFFKGMVLLSIHTLSYSLSLSPALSFSVSPSYFSPPFFSPSLYYHENFVYPIFFAPSQLLAYLFYFFSLFALCPRVLLLTIYIFGCRHHAEHQYGSKQQNTILRVKKKEIGNKCVAGSHFFICSSP